MDSQSESVVIVGLGYVGLPLAVLTQKRGYQVIGLDIDEEKVSSINRGKSPYLDNDLQADLELHPFYATTDANVLHRAGIIVVCVPTPLDAAKKPDLMPLLNACKIIAQHTVKGKLVIIESTINPGICDDILIPLFEEESGLKVGIDFSLAHCPERINPGDKQWKTHNIPRVVGGFDERSLFRARAFYENILDGTVYPMGSIKEAEAVKLVENSFRDVNIAFVNELAVSFSKMGLDVVSVINGAATKPFAFMPHYPGIGVGGHCIPVDPIYLIEYAKIYGQDHKLLKLARETNSAMPTFGIDLLRQGMENLDKNIALSNVGVLGLSYKENVGDLRESPSLDVVMQLREIGARVLVHDPHVTIHDDNISQYNSLGELLEEADAIIICTSHDEYRDLIPSSFEGTNVAVVVDGRNCLDKNAYAESGIIYKGVGR